MPVIAFEICFYSYKYVFLALNYVRIMEIICLMQQKYYSTVTKYIRSLSI